MCTTITTITCNPKAVAASPVDSWNEHNDEDKKCRTCRLRHRAGERVNPDGSQREQLDKPTKV